MHWGAHLSHNWVVKLLKYPGGQALKQWPLNRKPEPAWQDLHML